MACKRFSGMDHPKNKSRPQPKLEAGRQARLLVFLFFFAVVSTTVLVTIKFGLGKHPGSTAKTNVSAQSATKTTNGELPTMEVAQAVMVTVELDFGPTIPSIAEALKQIERKHEPAAGAGRTFAVLDAYGEPTADHKLHLSMH